MSAITNPNASNLDQQQILQRAFDEAQDKLRVDATVSVGEITGEMVVDIDAATGDNIAIANADGSKKVTVTTVGAKEALDVNITNPQITVSVPTITNIPIPLANTEQSFTFPAGTKRFAVKIRASAKLKISYVSGMSGTNYIFIPIGCEYTEIDLDLTTGLPIYFQSESSGETLEIIAWN